MSMFHHRAKRAPTQMCYWSSLHILVTLHIHALHTCTQRDLGIKSKGTLHEIVTISTIKRRYQRFFHKSNYKYFDTDLTLQFGQTPGNLACSYARPLEDDIWSLASHQLSPVRLLFIKKESGSRIECFLSMKHSWKQKMEGLVFFQEDKRVVSERNLESLPLC